MHNTYPYEIFNLIHIWNYKVLNGELKIMVEFKVSDCDGWNDLNPEEGNIAVFQDFFFYYLLLLLLICCLQPFQENISYVKKHIKFSYKYVLKRERFLIVHYRIMF